ncbi:MAG TPA: hypothetical protein VMV46_10485 [Thermoanaerobaculia bacterium]|nr:hypothetical protein [Thermoanaerobaculia bacterium]
MATQEKRNFNMPMEEPAKIKPKLVAGEKALDLGALVGSWHACDQQTRGLVRVDLAKKGSDLTVHVFGACQPTPCDWGAVEGIAYAENVSADQAIAFTAPYRFSFKDVIVTGLLDQGTLIVETYNRFKDGSGRSNYYSRGYFCRRRRDTVKSG